MHLHLLYKAPAKHISLQNYLKKYFSSIRGEILFIFALMRIAKCGSIELETVKPKNKVSLTQKSD